MQTQSTDGTRKGKRGGYRPPAPVPTEQEIEAACRLIRAQWSDATHRIRAGIAEVTVTAYLVPLTVEIDTERTPW